MPAVWVNQLPPAAAQAFCDALAAQGPARLAELSSWVPATDGPWEQLDASAASLVPLWERFVRFADEDFPRHSARRRRTGSTTAASRCLRSAISATPPRRSSTT